MAVAQQVMGDLLVQGNLIMTGQLMPGVTRTSIAQDNNTVHVVPWTAWRVWDAQSSNLPAAAAADDLGHVGGTLGSGTPSLQTGDVKALGTVTRYARCQVALPAEYQPGQPVAVRVRGGMDTTVAGTSAVVDIECYKSNKEAGQTAGDLCATAAQSINSLVFADKDFVITPTALVAGDILDIRLTVTTIDPATATPVIGVVGSVELLCSIKG